MSEKNSNGLGLTFLAFTLGAAIGGGLALLTAPRSGAESREKMRGMVDDKRVKLDELTEDAETRIKKVIQESHEVLEKKVDLIKAALKAGKDAIDAEKAKQKKSTKADTPADA
ncbi:YtxH domain-containing protein [Geopsychrobacter electrodiphilus]|uniref:YtxH domain-containing protein n=1 Tax=Geopsychrobacter electrodiphilus TaxID=225196 RepID=UPI0003747A77|nr:YtxH domain-containing protein [Geopsychrobacter electrodiphilus]